MIATCLPWCDYAPSSAHNSPELSKFLFWSFYCCFATFNYLRFYFPRWDSRLIGPVIHAGPSQSARVKPSLPYWSTSFVSLSRKSISKQVLVWQLPIGRRRTFFTTMTMASFHHSDPFSTSSFLEPHLIQFYQPTLIQQNTSSTSPRTTTFPILPSNASASDPLFLTRQFFATSKTFYLRTKFLPDRRGFRTYPSLDSLKTRRINYKPIFNSLLNQTLLLREH